MSRSARAAPSLGLHMTNVTGLGATTLMKSLLPVIEAQALQARFGSVHIYLPPQKTALGAYETTDARVTIAHMRRWLPNALSRLCECTLSGWRYAKLDALIVFGDLPISFVSRQILFVHTAHVTRSSHARGWADRLKYGVARLVFRFNLRFVCAVIVQTSLMAQRLVETYPSLSGKIAVIPQPPPSWLLQGMSRAQRTGRVKEGLLKLIYPAASYTHKNHDLLYRGVASPGWEDLAEVVLTVDRRTHPVASTSSLQCVGQLTPSDLIDYYATVDALLFPSLEESYGLPLVEAMYVGIPVLCADLPYARTLCGDGAIYFSPLDPDGIRRALVELRSRLERGWWPDWQQQLLVLPRDWSEVASRIINITHRATSSPSST